MSGGEQRVPAADGSDTFMSQAKIANYRSERGARAYFQDHQQKLHRRWSDRRERRILEQMLGACGRIDRLLDIPSGFGRLLDLFRGHADAVVEADYSESMLALNEELHGDQAAGYLRCSALQIPEPDRSFAVTVSVRLNHHLETVEDRVAHIRELCRVSRDHVVVTYFSSSSWKNRLRELRRRWNKKRSKNTLSEAQVREAFAACGFEVRTMRALSRLGSGHVYVLASRRPG